MKEIIAHYGEVIFVDDSDYDFLSKFTWGLHKNNVNGITYDSYVTAENNTNNGKYSGIAMSRILLNLINDTSIKILFKNGNRLDHTRSNLRVVNNSINGIRRGKFRGKYTSKYKGVSRTKKSNSFEVWICKNGENKYLGKRDCEEDAALLYDLAAISLFGKDAYTNLPKENYAIEIAEFEQEKSGKDSL